MALRRPGVPSNGIPIWRARSPGFAPRFGCGDFLIAPTDSGLDIEVIEGILQARGTTTMANLLDGRSAIITGAGSGSGRATALVFAREGAPIVVADLVEQGGRETVEMIRGIGGDA